MEIIYNSVWQTRGTLSFFHGVFTCYLGVKTNIVNDFHSELPQIALKRSLTVIELKN